jgi:hypothetical protein
MQYKVTLVATTAMDRAVVVVDAASEREAKELALRKVAEGDENVEWEEIDILGDDPCVIECEAMMEPAAG